MIALEPDERTRLLLVALKNTGRIVRLDPPTGDVTEIATGLNQPTALVIDPVTGDLLIAEQDRISAINKEQLHRLRNCKKTTRRTEFH